MNLQLFLLINYLIFHFTFLFRLQDISWKYGRFGVLLGSEGKRRVEKEVRRCMRRGPRVSWRLGRCINSRWTTKPGIYRSRQTLNLTYMYKIQSFHVSEFRSLYTRTPGPCWGCDLCRQHDPQKVSEACSTGLGMYSIDRTAKQKTLMDDFYAWREYKVS